MPTTIAYEAPPQTPEIELYEELRPVCGCESVGDPTATPRHYFEGEVIRGRINPDDIGMCQINQHYHLETAEKMGIDIFEKEGNIEYANYLYDQQGYEPWSWSKSCWEDYT